MLYEFIMHLIIVLGMIVRAIVNSQSMILSLMVVYFFLLSFKLRDGI